MIRTVTTAKKINKWPIDMWKMFNINNDQGNASENKVKYHFTPTRTAIIKKKIVNAGEDVRKSEHLYTVGGM